MGARPKVVDFACGSLVFLTIYLWYRGIKPVVSPTIGREDALAMVTVISIAVAFGLGLIVLAWLRKAWARYLIPVWFLIPMGFGELGEAPVFEVSSALLVLNRLVSNWFVWVYLFPCLLLLLPLSNRWYRGSVHAAT